MQCTESLFYVVALGSQALDESGLVNYGAASLPRASLELHALQQIVLLSHARVGATFSQCTACDSLFSHRHSLVLRLLP